MVVQIVNALFACGCFSLPAQRHLGDETYMQSKVPRVNGAGATVAVAQHELQFARHYYSLFR